MSNSKSLNKKEDIKGLIMNAMQEILLWDMQELKLLSLLKTSKYQLNIIDEYLRFKNEKLLLLI